jgi:hypothetical protein
VEERGYPPLLHNKKGGKQMLTENAKYFMEHAHPKLALEDIDLELYGGWYDDLAFPIVYIRSKLLDSERMRRFGVEAFEPGLYSMDNFALDEQGKARRSSQGYYIPSEERIKNIVAAYGDKYTTRHITLEPYRRLPIEAALDKAGTDLRSMLDKGEYELVQIGDDHDEEKHET